MKCWPADEWESLVLPCSSTAVRLQMSSTVSPCWRVRPTPPSCYSGTPLTTMPITSGCALTSRCDRLPPVACLLPVDPRARSTRDTG